MKHKKHFVVAAFVVAIMLFQGMTVFAAQQPELTQGSIKIVLTDGAIGTAKGNVIFEYEKVADIIDGEYVLTEEYQDVNVNLNEIQYSEDLGQATKELEKHIQAEHTVVTNKKGEATISDLELGVYLLRVSDKAGYENVKPALVSVPTWDEEQKDMNYHVAVYPKHCKTVVRKSPQTGDEMNWGSVNQSVVACVVAGNFIIIAGLSCHMRFKCGKISFKYLSVGGYTDGNDNDTKNPCSPRRIRQRSSRSVN